MRARLLTPFVLALCALSACGGGGGKITIGEAAPRESVLSGTDDGSSGTDDGSSAPVDTDDTVTVDEPTGSESGDSGDVALDVDKCLEVSEAFSGVAGAAAGMTPEEAQASVDKMKSVLPDDLSDDIQTMVDAYAASPAEIGEKLSSQEFMDANTAVTDYLTQICGGG